MRDLDRRALRRRIVVVSQDVFLFAGTLGDNIGLGDPGLTREAILAAARRVGADRVIARRPEGLDAPVIERGANFSAGERQLIAFARALCRDPEILILDEATASVDPETERLIERGTEELMRGRTSIVIAHRLSTIRRATRIVAIHKGRIAEEGKPRRAPGAGRHLRAPLSPADAGGTATPRPARPGTQADRCRRVTPWPERPRKRCRRPPQAGRALASRRAKLGRRRSKTPGFFLTWGASFMLLHKGEVATCSH